MFPFVFADHYLCTNTTYPTIILINLPLIPLIIILLLATRRYVAIVAIFHL